MTLTLIETLILTVTCGAGWLTIAYSGYANARGWPVGAWLAGDFSWLQGLAYFALIGAPLIAFARGPWWVAVIVLAAGNILVRFVLPTFRAQSQFIALAGVILGLVASVVIALQ